MKIAYDVFGEAPHEMDSMVCSCFDGVVHFFGAALSTLFGGALSLFHSILCQGNCSERVSKNIKS